jgi:hypothetical protein
MNCLALDLGTSTGYAFNDGNYFECGTWKLARAKDLKEAKKQRWDRRRDIRINNFYDILQQLRQRIFDTVVFEDVQFASYTQQVQLWSSLRAIVWVSFGVWVNMECVPVGTLKKFATGNGSALKSQMEIALLNQFPKEYSIGQCGKVSRLYRSHHELNGPLDDNAVDAIWLWKWAKQNLSRV